MYRGAAAYCCNCGAAALVQAAWSLLGLPGLPACVPCCAQHGSGLVQQLSDRTGNTARHVIKHVSTLLCSSLARSPLHPRLAASLLSDGSKQRGVGLLGLGKAPSNRRQLLALHLMSPVAQRYETHNRHGSSLYTID
jgi:hypothetical protein